MGITSIRGLECRLTATLTYLKALSIPLSTIGLKYGINLSVRYAFTRHSFQIKPSLRWTSSILAQHTEHTRTASTRPKRNMQRRLLECSSQKERPQFRQWWRNKARLKGLQQAAQADFSSNAGAVKNFSSAYKVASSPPLPTSATRD